MSSSKCCGLMASLVTFSTGSTSMMVTGIQTVRTTLSPSTTCNSTLGQSSATRLTTGITGGRKATKSAKKRPYTSEETMATVTQMMCQDGAARLAAM